MCNIYKNPERNNSIIAIVETVAELWVLSVVVIFARKDHVLGS